MQALQGGEAARLGSSRGTEHGEQPRRTRGPFQLDLAGLQQRNALRRPRHLLRHQNIDAKILGGRLDPRRDVHDIAHRRIIEAFRRPHITDAGQPGVKTDADPDLRLRHAACRKAKGVGFIERLQRGAHRQRRPAGARGMVLDIDRRVPERHDRVADIFVDRAEFGLNGIGQRRQQRVDEIDQFGRAQRFR